MEKPFLTPENVMLPKHQLDANSWGSNKCLDLHMEINSYLDFLLDIKGYDSGAGYAAWLNSLGFQHQSDEGWWNQTSVDLDKMDLFVNYSKWDPDTEDSLMQSIDDRIATIGKATNLKGVRVNLLTHHCKVESYLVNEGKQ